MKEDLKNSPLLFRVVDVLRYIVRHPIEVLVRRWNWKAAVLSALLRAPIFFFSYFRKDGLKMAIGAAIEDLLLIWRASEAEEWINQMRRLPL